MPLYEYRCTACDRLTEKRQKFSDPEITDCPHCNGKLERTITAPAIQFKGGGWYADGYGSKKPAASGSAESGNPSSDSKGTDAAKPAANGDSSASAAAPASVSAAPTSTPTSGSSSTT